MEKGMEGMPGMMAPEAMRDQRRGEMDAYMRSLPQKERLKIQQKIRRFDSQKERGQYIARLLEKSKGYERWNAKAVFEDLSFTTAQECVDALAERFLALPVSNDQQQLIAEALGAKEGLNSPLKPADLETSEMNAALHLLLSTAEYQLT